MMNYQCPAEFNVPTSLLDCDGYRKRMQESTDPFKYKMALRPGPMCMQAGQSFQGLMLAQRRPPPNLLGVENYLRSAPILEDQREYAIDDIHKARPPRMPKPLSNKLIIPQCDELPGYQYTKIKSKLDSPAWSLRMERNGRRYPDYARPGRDTRAEVREAWKKKEEKEIANSNIYGVSKYDKRPLTTGNNSVCLSELPCMNVYGPNGEQFADGSSTSATTSTTSGVAWNTAGVTTTSLGPTFSSLPGAPSIGNATTATSASDAIKVTPGTVNGIPNGTGSIGANANGTGSGTGAAGWRSAETLAAAAGINTQIPYSQQLAAHWQKAGCNVKFANYNPTVCK